MRNFGTILLLSAAFVAASGQPAPDAQAKPAGPKFSLKLSELRPEGYSGKNLFITIEMTNTSEQVIGCSSFIETNSVNHSLRYDVRDPQGNAAEKVALSSHPEIGIAGSSYPCSLKPGDSKKWDVAINKAYRLDRPGEYTIQVSRLAETRPADGYIKSNTITITVLPADVPPPTQ
jgi:hypothetical protein